MDKGKIFDMLDMIVDEIISPISECCGDECEEVLVRDNALTKIYQICDNLRMELRKEI